MPNSETDLEIAERIDLDLVDLASVAHVERESEAPARLRDTVAVQLRVRLLLKGFKRTVDAGRIERACLDVDLLVHMQDVRGGRPEGAPGGGDFLLRDYDSLHPELVGENTCVRGARAAEREQHEVARIESLLDGHLADDVCHLELGDPGDAARRLHERELKRSRDALYRCDGFFTIEPHAPAQKILRIDGAEHDVGI